ncbi:MAG: hypothetical protein KI791_18400 [Cyclobacteriaceae bacterium]|nr:hypothetical protein [Cyclobacteriaceae bacterium SS2]
MNIVKDIWNWILRNVSNLIGFLGLIATIYFGAFYIPDYLEEIKSEKIRTINKELVRTTKELIFNDTTFEAVDIKVLIDSKKITYGIEYPFNAIQLLFFVQESFMEDSYLPLSRRKELFDKIELLKSNLKVNDNRPPKSSFLGTLDLLSILSASLSVIIAIIAFISLYRKRQLEKAKEEELTTLEEQAINESSSFDRHRKFESNLTETLSSIEGVKVLSKIQRTGIDICFTFRDRTFYVEVKNLNRSKVAQSSVANFLLLMNEYEGIGLFVYNTELTQMAKKRINEFNKFSTSMVYPIRVQNPKDKRRILNLLETISSST